MVIAAVNADVLLINDGKNLQSTILWHAEPPPQSQHPAKFSGHKSSESEGINFSYCAVTQRWSRDQRILWLSGWDFFTVSHYLVQIGVHGSSATGNMYLICHEAFEYELLAVCHHPYKFGDHRQTS